MAQTPSETLSVRVPTTTADAFRAHVTNEGLTVNAALRQAVVRRLSERP